MLRTTAAAVLLLLLTACHVDATVGVRVDDRGAGSVTARFVLDADTVKSLHDVGRSPSDAARTGDLRARRWSITSSTAKDGSATIVATKRFRDAAQLSQVIDELSGPSGPFRAFRLRRTRTSLRATTSLTGDVVLQGEETGIANDTELQQRLGGAGVDTGDLQRTLQSAYARYFTLRVAFVLPGHTTDNAPQHVGGQPVWVPKIGEHLHLVARSTASRHTRPVLVVGAVVFAVLAVAIAVWPRRRRNRRTPSVSSPS